jgi:hypothetical protein
MSAPAIVGSWTPSWPFPMRHPPEWYITRTGWAILLREWAKCEPEPVPTCPVLRRSST